jgi:hypothetical protein
MEHTRQFIDLWIQLRDVHLDDGVEDVIAWRFPANGEYLVFPPTKCNPWSYLDQHEYDDVEGLVTAKDEIIRFASHSKHIWMLNKSLLLYLYLYYL